jgi:hypothetical protein
VLAAKGRAIPSFFWHTFWDHLSCQQLPLHARITSTKKLLTLPAELGSITMVLRCNCGVNLCARATAVSAFVLVFVWVQVSYSLLLRTKPVKRRTSKRTKTPTTFLSRRAPN